MPSAWLLTGRPGIGKTTCVRRVLERIRVPAGGFLTEEIREGGQRTGFALVTLSGERFILAHARRQGTPRVGKYAVDVGGLDRLGVPAILGAIRPRTLVVIDEIGKMEMASAAFRDAVEAALAADVPILGTILKSPHPWADEIKRRAGVQVLEVTAANRDALPDQLAKVVGEAATLRRERRRGSGPDQ